VVSSVVRLAARHEAALGDDGAADATANGRRRVNPGRVELPAAPLDRRGLGRRFFRGRLAPFTLLERHGTCPRAARRARATGPLDGRAGACELGAQPVHLCLGRPGIDLEQQLAAADEGAFLEADGGNQPGDTRTNRDRVHGLQPAGELVPFGDVPREDRRRRDLRRRGIGVLCGGLCARRQQPDGDSGAGNQPSLRPGESRVMGKAASVHAPENGP
jgi:hypothetical protein